MYDELAEIREHSMAMDKEENELGVSCIAVPVFDIHGRVPYAISISLSTSRSYPSRTLKPSSLEIASAVSRRGVSRFFSPICFMREVDSEIEIAYGTRP